MDDFSWQAALVAGLVPRILAQIDTDPLSPTHGSAHLAYWRDKSSPVADMRRQEAAFTLALLYRHPYPGSTWQNHPELLAAIDATLGNWVRGHYPDGSLDEWYQGERAFAAAAFTTHAVARTLLLVGENLPAHRVIEVHKALAQTASWLCRRNDLFKTNHQAVGVAALAFAAQALNDPSLHQAAREKLASILAVQTPEGWFPEVGHMDVGYTFLTVEFLLMAMSLWNDWTALPAVQKAFAFATHFIHPDATVGTEYGVCHNPFLSRVAVVLLSPHSPQALALRRRFEEETIGHPGTTPTLACDLRLLRWGYQPLLAFNYWHETRLTNPPPPTPPWLWTTSTAPPRLTHWPASGLAGWVGSSGNGLVAVCAGGVVRLFDPGRRTLLALHGYAVSSGQHFHTNLTYDRRLPATLTGSGLHLQTNLARVRKFMPPFWARVALHLACTTAWGSRLTRMAIDLYRHRKGSALNQSSANLASHGRGAYRLERRVTPDALGVTLIDRLDFDHPITPERLFQVIATTNAPPQLLPIPGLPPTALRTVTIHAHYRPGPQGFLTTTWEVR